VRALSKVFRTKYIEKLQELLDKNDLDLPPSLSGLTTVRFTYRDRSNGDRRKIASLPGEEFIGRFLLHVLPPGFMRIRHYGFQANRAKKTCLAQCREQLGASAPEPAEAKTVADWIPDLTGIDITRCPQCGAPLEREERSPLRL